jgi:hypothetical protein
MLHCEMSERRRKEGRREVERVIQSTGSEQWREDTSQDGLMCGEVEGGEVGREDAGLEWSAESDVELQVRQGRRKHVRGEGEGSDRPKRRCWLNVADVEASERGREREGSERVRVEVKVE